MKTRQVSRLSAVALPIEYTRAARLALVAILMLGLFALAPRVLAQSPNDLPFALQSGLVTAHLDKNGLPVGGMTGLPWGLRSGLESARGAAYVASLSLVGGTGLPFGLQPGLVTAKVASVAALGLVGGAGVPYGLQSGLATAHLDAAGQLMAGVQRGIDAGAARYAAMGKYYLDLAAAREQGVTVLAENPELILARRAAVGSAAGPDTVLAQNPELILSRYAATVKAYFAVARGAETDAARWAAIGQYYTSLASSGTGADGETGR